MSDLMSLIEAHLGRPLSAPEQQRANSLRKAGISFLEMRYGDRYYMHQVRARALVSEVLAGMIARRLGGMKAGIGRQGAGPFSVSMTDEASGGGMFFAAELADLDAMFSRGGTRTYRTPAPASQWRGNRLGSRGVGGDDVFTC